jgi:glucose/arabinose dehydrogenase
MNKKSINKFCAAALLLSATTLTSVCQTKKATGETKSAETAVPQVTTVDKPKTYQIDPNNLPKPFASQSASRSSRLVEQPKGAQLSAPKGFKINVFAEGDFTYPRMMALAPNGDVFVADSRGNSIVVLRDANKDGKAEERFTFSEDVRQPFGIHFFKDWLYVANTDSVVRFRYKSGQTKADAAPEKLIELTEGGYNQHWTRNIIFSPDGSKLFVSIGSSGNVDIESDARRAAISVYDIDGKNHRIFASGIRNPIGLAFNPTTKELWTAVNERDGLGDDLVPDYVTSVRENGFYGFPYYYLGENIDPRRKDDIANIRLQKPIMPDVLIASHSAALGMVFYDAKMFPAEYQGDAFVALHGSWNREKLTGYKIIRIRFKDGKPVSNSYEDFISGWLPSESSREVWGRPVGLMINSDGSLLIADDGGKKIWRVSYQK